jgi:GTPase SAR1 family protein
LLVFDITSRRSFESLDGWIREANSFGVPNNVCIVLCGNKVRLIAVDVSRTHLSLIVILFVQSDLSSDRQVTDAEATAWAKQRNMKCEFLPASVPRILKLNSVFFFRFQVL